MWIVIAEKVLISCSMDKNQLKELILASKYIPLTIPGAKEPIQEENNNEFCFCFSCCKKSY